MTVLRGRSLGDQAKQSETQEWSPAAIQEFRRLHKSLFYLDYICNESLRLLIRSILNKGEPLHSMARDLFGRQELFRVRDYEALLNRTSCRSLLTKAIAVWNYRSIWPPSSTRDTSTSRLQTGVSGSERCVPRDERKSGLNVVHCVLARDRPNWNVTATVLQPGRYGPVHSGHFFPC